MGSGSDSKWTRVLGVVLVLIPALLIGWFVPGASDLFGGSAERRKPLSAEAKFLWLVFGLAGWWFWHTFGAR